MVAKKALNLRIYPSTAQKRWIRQNIGCCRFLYNKMLAERKEFYENNKDKDRRELYEHDYMTEKQYKEIYPWLKYADSQALQQSRRDLSMAYQNFFAKRASFPKFHKKNVKNSYRTTIVGTNIEIDFSNKKIKLPKLGWIKYIDDRTLQNGYKIINVTVKISNGRNFYASICYEYDTPEIKKVIPNNPRIKGVDMSFGKFYVDTDNSSLEYKRPYRTEEKSIARLQKQLEARRKGSKGWHETKLKLGKKYESIKNRRKDFIEKVSTRLVKDNDVIVIESLNLSAIAQNKMRGHSKSVLDLGWGNFVNRTKAKCEEQGKHLIEADRYFASSKTCSGCGYHNSEVTLGVTEWCCPNCGELHDRDVNAAKNLEQQGYKWFNELVATPGFACGKTEGQRRGTGMGSMPATLENNPQSHRL